MPDEKLEDTIAAIATPVGTGGIAVIRISGEEAFGIVGRIFYPQKGRLADFPSHTIHYGRILNEKKQLIDQVLVSLFQKPHSYTGEPVIEISVHGGLVVTKTVLDLLLRQGARMAEPGEFTKRAFLNGKIDLAQAEAVMDLIHARSSKSMETAARQLAGTLSSEFKRLRDDLLKIHAHLEAFLDFPDEQLDIFNDSQFLDRFKKVRLEIQRLIASFQRGSILREGVTVAIAGKPNAGKSSLFNALLERDRAIVSEYPGTTRDTLEEAIEVAGIYVRLVDTAGLTSDLDHPLDQISMRRTREALQQADLCLFLVDGTRPLEEADRTVFKAFGAHQKVLTVINKSDLPGSLAIRDLCAMTGTQYFLKISVMKREGLDQLEQKIAETIMKETCTGEGEQVTRLRHLRALEQAATSLSKAESSFAAGGALEYVIIDLKESLDHLNELIGAVYSEDLLDVIFSEFCIGK